MDSVESHMNLSIEKVQRELERLKFDVADQVEQRQEAMQRSFQIELETIKNKYEESVDLVTDASKNLG